MTKTIMIMIIMMTMIINENYENNNEVTQTNVFIVYVTDPNSKIVLTSIM